MLHHHLFSLTIVAVLALLSSAAPNQPTLVNLRIEGSANTIFEGTIVTTGHNVTTASGGNHHCDGTNNNGNPLPGPTCTSALDDASKIPSNLFSFDGQVSYFTLHNMMANNPFVGNRYSTFSAEFDDFFITSIGGVTQTSTQFWGILLNFEFTQVGGCQQEVNANDEILFAFDAFNANAFLKLTGPATARINKMFFVTVTDAQTGKPVAGAAVSFGISDANGNVPFNLGFTRIGVQKFKATKPGAIRSNEITIVVSA